MRKEHFIITLLFFVICKTFAQSPLSVKWLNNSKGTSWDLVSDMVIDDDNNIYVVGNFKDSTRVDKRIFGHQEDVFIAKFNSDGDSVWEQKLKSDNYYHIKTIVIGESGQSYICGYQYNINIKDVKSDEGENFTILFIDKIDKNGDRSRITELKGYFNSNPVILAERKDFGILVGGSFNQIMFQDSIYKSQCKSDIYLLQYKPTGKPENLILLSGLGKKVLNDIRFDLQGSIYLTGSFEKELIVNENSIKSIGRSDGYLIKFDQNFVTQHIKQIGGDYSDYCKSLVVDSLNNILVAGSFSGNIITENNDTLVSNGKLDAFIVKYNPYGEPIWTRTFGGAGNEYLSNCIVNSRGEIYINGSFRGVIEEGDYKVVSQEFSSDIFVVKYNGDGQFKFIEAIGDTNSDFAGRMLIDSLNYLYLTGNYNDNMKVLTDTTQQGTREDFYLTKLYDCDFSVTVRLPNDTSLCGTQFVIVADSGFSKYLWNDIEGGCEFIADSTGKYYLEVRDEQGCITSDTIYIHINHPLQVDLGEDIQVKRGDIVKITTNNKFDEYLWSTSETSDYIELNTENFEEGSYHINVVTKDSNGCSTNDMTIVQVVSDVKFTVYPVPAKHLVNLHIQNVEPENKIEYQMITESGNVLFTESRITNDISFNKEINTSKLEPGVYYIKVLYKELASTLKVIKL